MAICPIRYVLVVGSGHPEGDGIRGSVVNFFWTPKGVRVLIQITTIRGELLKSVVVEIQAQDETYWPCHYCGNVLVRVPRKFCCDSHRVTYCKKQIGTASN